MSLEWDRRRVVIFSAQTISESCNAALIDIINIQIFNIYRNCKRALQFGTKIRYIQPWSCVEHLKSKCKIIIMIVEMLENLPPYQCVTFIQLWISILSANMFAAANQFSSIDWHPTSIIIIIIEHSHIPTLVHNYSEFRILLLYKIVETRNYLTNGLYRPKRISIDFYGIEQRISAFFCVFFLLLLEIENQNANRIHCWLSISCVSNYIYLVMPTVDSMETNWLLLLLRKYSPHFVHYSVTDKFDCNQ